MVKVVAVAGAIAVQRRVWDPRVEVRRIVGSEVEHRLERFVLVGRVYRFALA
jgi:hypothetical protein